MRIDELSPEEQLAQYQGVVQAHRDTLSWLAGSLANAAASFEGASPETAAPELRQLLDNHLIALKQLLVPLYAALDLPDAEADSLQTQVSALTSRLESKHTELVQAQQDYAELGFQYATLSTAHSKRGAQLSAAELRLLTLEQEKQQLAQQIDSLRPQVRELEERKIALDQQVASLERRVTTQPGDIGTALGNAVDAIQRGLLQLQNPYVDYGLQELDLQTQVNIQLEAGNLSMRFPGLNEEIAPQNLSQLHLRLRPIPKQQELAGGDGSPELEQHR